MGNWIVSIQPISKPGEPPLAANLGFNTQVEAPNPLAAGRKALELLVQTFEISGLTVVPEPGSPDKA